MACKKTSKSIEEEIKASLVDGRLPCAVVGAPSGHTASTTVDAATGSPA